MILHGDCLSELAGIESGTIDSVVTDPPYGLSNTRPDQVADTIVRWALGERDYLPEGKGFMGKAWDGFVPPPAVWDECWRVLKPGGHMLVFAGTRTQDLMGLSIRLAGFELRDSLAWIYGSGFPKSLNVGKATGDERWAGWGTALKPGQEPILLARKPPEGTVAGNVLEWGTGALNIDACRVATDDVLGRAKGGWLKGGYVGGESPQWDSRGTTVEGGRWPANVLLDPEAAAAMDEQSGTLRARGNVTPTAGGGGMYGHRVTEVDHGVGDQGGASRFFPVFKYQAKAPKRERPVIEREDGTKVQHPTVKPLALMRWLVRMICPPGGTVLDPFAGSGTTIEAALLEGMNPIGIERETEYLPLIEARIARAAVEPNLFEDAL